MITALVLHHEYCSTNHARQSGDIVKGKTKPSSKSNITLSVDSLVLDEIRKQAESEGLSVNAKINLVLSKYAIFYSHAEKQESLIMPRRNFQVLLNDVDESRFIETLKDNTLDLMPSIFLERGIPFNLDTVIQLVFEIIGRYSGIYSNFTHRKNADGTTNLIFTHGYDIKWSRILAITFSDFFKTHLHLKTEYKLMPSTITLKVLKN